MREPAESEFLEWKQSYVTKYVLEQVTSRREEYKEMLASGGTVNNPDNTTERVVGSCEALQDVLNMYYDELKDLEGDGGSDAS